MQEYIDVEVPCDEDCVQVGTEDYYKRARGELRRLQKGLIHYFGEPPEGVRFKIASNPHDFGSYLTLQIWYNDEDEEAMNWALDTEDYMPATWHALETETWRIRIKENLGIVETAIYNEDFPKGVLVKREQFSPPITVYAKTSKED